MTDLRTDLIHVFIFRQLPPPSPAEPEGPIQFLQLQRSGGSVSGTWQPVMGGIEPGENPLQAALRELEEEVGLTPTDARLLDLWALEQAPPFYMHRRDTLWISPRFAAQVSHDWEPTLNHEHTDKRWIPAEQVEQRFMWPSNIVSCREILDLLLRPGSLCRQTLRLPIPGRDPPQ